jgi:hypothetical protein
MLCLKIPLVAFPKHSLPEDVVWKQVDALRQKPAYELRFMFAAFMDSLHFIQMPRKECQITPLNLSIFAMSTLRALACTFAYS